MIPVPRVRVQYQYPPPPGLFVLGVRWVALSLAAACFAWGGYTIYDQYTHQEEADVLFREAVRESAVAPASPKGKGRRSRPDTEAPIVAAPSASRIKLPVAKLDIPRLQVSGYVENGLDADTLRKAIGHSPSSARPGERGNIVLAAHRDTFFSGLRGVKLGDAITLKAPTGKSYDYLVTKIFVVSPEDNWVMRPVADQKMLTLITCYPFSFVGHAPQRLIVQAQQLETNAAPQQHSISKRRIGKKTVPAPRRNRI